MPTKQVAPYRKVFRFLVDNPEWAPEIVHDENGNAYFIGLSHAGSRSFMSWEVFFSLVGES